MKSGLCVGGVTVIERDNYLTSVLPEANTLDAYHINKPAFTACKNNILKAYREAGFQGVVYIMPVGGVESVYNGNKFNIADEAMLRGYYYSPRLHVDLWGNSWGK